MCIVNIGVKVVPNYNTEGGGNTPEVVCQLPKKMDIVSSPSS